MAINVHHADTLIHRLLQQQGSSSSHKASSQQQTGAGVSEKVTISEQARSEASNQAPSKLESKLLQLYGPRGN